MIAYTLDKDISGDILLKDINKLIDDFKKQNTDKVPILYIDIRSITYEDTSMIPKLQHDSQ